MMEKGTISDFLIFIFQELEDSTFKYLVIQVPHQFTVHLSRVNPE